MKKSTSPVIFIFCMIVGACLLGISFKEIYSYSIKSNNYDLAEAKVVKHNYENGKVSSVVLEYTVGDYTYTTSSTYSDDCIKSYGSTIYIRYNPKNPEELIFTNRGINIVIPIVAIVVLSVGIAVVIVQIFDNIKGIKRKLVKFSVKENSITTPDSNEVIDISDVFKKPDPIPVKKEIIEEEVNKEVIDIPFVSKEPTYRIENTVKDLDQKFENVNYREFISEVDTEEVPSFIPNIDELSNRKQ